MRASRKMFVLHVLLTRDGKMDDKRNNMYKGR